MGIVKIFAGNFAPRGWAFCHGQLLPISQYNALFSLLGTIYGGDGRTTFGLPDLRGRSPISSGSGPGLRPYEVGHRGGVETVTLNTTQMPTHNHLASGSVLTGPDNSLTNVSAGNALAHDARNANTPLDIYTTDTPTVPMHANSLQVQVNNNGGNQPHENRSPYLAMNYIIALEGLYPSRS